MVLASRKADVLIPHLLQLTSKYLSLLFSR